MIKFSKYIIEKLHLDKDLNITNEEIIFFYWDKKNSNWNHLYVKSLEEVVDFTDEHYPSLGDHEVFICKSTLSNKLIDEVEYNINPKAFYKNTAMWTWIANNNIHRCTANELNAIRAERSTFLKNKF